MDAVTGKVLHFLSTGWSLARTDGMSLRILAVLPQPLDTPFTPHAKLPLANK